MSIRYSNCIQVKSEENFVYICVSIFISLFDFGFFWGVFSFNGHRLLLSINSKVFYMHHPTDRITHTTAFVTPVVEHWLEREMAQWVHPMKDRSDEPPHHERTLYL